MSIYDAKIILPEKKLVKSKLIIGQVQSGKTKFMINEVIEKLCLDFKISIVLGGTNNLLLSQTEDKFIPELDKNKISYIGIKDNTLYKLSKNKTCISLLKGSSSLEKLKDLMEFNWEEKTLIIDDESDFAGINISKKGCKKSAIHSKLRELFLSMNQGEFLSITATPFADLLSPDSIQYDDIHFLTPDKNYTGLDYFMERHSSVFNTIDLNENIRDFSDNEQNIWIPIIIDHIKRIHISGKKVTQLLINTSSENEKHIEFQEKIIELLKNLKKIPFKSLFDIKSDDERKKYLEIINTLYDNTSFLNQKNKSWDKNTHSIIIGGTCVSRGYTFENLLTTIMFNEPSEKNNADTLLQRCRWFGYRKEYFDFIKVYCSKKIVDSLFECQILLSLMEKNKNDISKLRESLKNIKFDHIELTGKVKNRGINGK